MNFLSHYYFDRDVTDCYHILGTVLPDLLKNADKTVVLHPEKLHHTNSKVNSIINGWNKHLAVDRYFHSSEFFKTNSHKLKKKLLPSIEGSPVKPFFLGHIAVELILDSLLITVEKINVDDFYDHLGRCEDDIICDFFEISGLKNPGFFLKYLEKFKKDRYLHTYADISKITYALRRICMRIWQDPFTPEQEYKMTGILTHYNTSLLPDYLLIFNEIAEKLAADQGPSSLRQ